MYCGIQESVSRRQKIARRLRRTITFATVIGAAVYFGWWQWQKSTHIIIRTETKRKILEANAKVRLKIAGHEQDFQVPSDHDLLPRSLPLLTQFRLMFLPVEISVSDSAYLDGRFEYGGKHGRDEHLSDHAGATRTSRRSGWSGNKSSIGRFHQGVEPIAREHRYRCC